MHVRGRGRGEAWIAVESPLSGFLAWSPDGGSLLAVAADPKQASSIIPLAEAGDQVPLQIAYDAHSPYGPPQWSPINPGDPPTAPSVAGTALDPGTDGSPGNGWRVGAPGLARVPTSVTAGLRRPRTRRPELSSFYVWSVAVSPPPSERSQPSAVEWDADTYHQLADPHVTWGRRVLARLPLRGDETVLDAGCGTGRLTAELLEFLPRGRVVAVDASAEMLRVAREHLAPRFGDRVAFVRADLQTLILPNPVDAVFSTATFHWAG